MGNVKRLSIADPNRARDAEYGKLVAPVVAGKKVRHPPLRCRLPNVGGNLNVVMHDEGQVLEGIYHAHFRNRSILWP